VDLHKTFETYSLMSLAF